MKFLVPGFLIFVLLNSCTNNKYPPRPTFIFPGMVWVNNKLLIDATETTNAEWKLFLYWKKHQIFFLGNPSSKKIINDTSNWKKANDLDPVVPGDYFSDPKYNNFPLVGITYEQAIEFCKWKTDYYHQKYSSYRGYKKIIYRLPTAAEWERIASDGLDLSTYPFGMIRYNHEDCGYLMNVKENHTQENCQSKTEKKPRFYNNMMARADAYWPLRSSNTYNMVGNISEMVAEKGIAKGGNYHLAADSCKVKNDQRYTKPEIWLGFRCVAEMLD